jgi:hypothetical protein
VRRVGRGERGRGRGKRERRPGAAGASTASFAIRCCPLRGAPVLGSGGSRKYHRGCVRSETMWSGLSLAGQESNSGLVRIGMEDRGGALVGFRRSQKKGERRRGQHGKRGAVSAVAKRTGGTAGVSLSHLRHRRRPPQALLPPSPNSPRVPPSSLLPHRI